MDREEMMNRMRESAEKDEHFWDQVKARLPENPFPEPDDTFRVLDIQTISDDCTDLIMIRESEIPGMEQMDHWRIQVEKKLFRKPTLRFWFSAGPMKKDFFEDELSA